MGSEAKCRAVFEGRACDGKALLETAFLLFRAEGLRLQIPFTAISELTADDRTLAIEWDGKRLELELGSAAERWKEKIANPPSLMKKLGVTPGTHVALMKLGSFRKELEAAGAKVSRSPELIFFGAERRADLTSVDAAASRLPEKAALWIVYPKGRKEITENDVLAAGRMAGLVDVKVASFSETHTALKFVAPRKR